MKAQLDTGRLAFEEAIAAFAQRLDLVGTRRYDDLRAEEHYRAFAVAGAMKADLLTDLHEAVRKAVVDGGTIQEFRKDFFATVEKHGWSGWTGEGTKHGEAWRTRVIYQANTRKAYSTGRYAQLTDPEMLAVRPFWKWQHSGLARDPRPEHQAWHGMTLRHDHPFWQAGFPPRIPPDYGCGCYVVAVRAPRPGDSVEPPEDWESDSAAVAPPHDVVADIREFVAQKQAKLPPELARDFGEVVATYRLERVVAGLEAIALMGGSETAKRQGLVEFASIARDVSDRKIEVDLGPINAASRLSEQTGHDLEGFHLVVDNYGVRHTLKKHGTPRTEAARGQIAVTVEDFALIPTIAENFDTAFADGKNKVGRDVIVLTKVINGIGYRYVAEIRAGKKLVVTDSMRKKRSAWET